MSDIDLTKALRMLERHNFEGIPEEVLKNFVAGAQQALADEQKRQKLEKERRFKAKHQKYFDVLESWQDSPRQYKILSIPENDFYDFVDRLSTESGHNQILPTSELTISNSLLQLAHELRNLVRRSPNIFGDPLTYPSNFYPDRILTSDIEEQLNYLVESATVWRYDPTMNHSDVETYAQNVQDYTRRISHVSNEFPTLIRRISERLNSRLIIWPICDLNFLKDARDALKYLQIPLKSSSFGIIVDAKLESFPSSLRYRLNPSWLYA